MVEVIKRRKQIEAEPVIEIKGQPKEDVAVKPPVKQEVETKPKQEVKPPAEPKQPKPQQPQQVKQQTVKKSFFQNFVTGERNEQQGERLVFRMRSGEIVEGIIADEKSGFVKLTDAVITDKELGTISKVRWIRMERTQIAHFSPLPTEIELIEEQLP
ncbi:MAG: hypothetical protein HQK67_12620 [Desulfamplus sp.]|nr:hypothetical protein [Desulfamplus sp.]